ncbi:MAG: serine/threonine protein kinase, partial [Gemmataceae bacterium]|nr:serine/threonine protein kinase [Gemmataceae bacterium]
MANPGDLGNLKTNEWGHLQDIADRLAQAWRQGQSVDLGQFLPPAGDRLRSVILRELIKTEMELRWQRGQIVGLEYYLEKFPELGNAGTLSPELIFEEYRVRQFYGDKPALSAYQARFPNQYAELQRLEQSLGFQTPRQRLSNPVPALAQSTLNQQMLPVGGGYKLVRRLGSGGFGEVWQAEAPGGVAVAVKLIFRPLDHDEAQRELQSLELIKGLRHPFLLQTQAYWSFEDRLYIVMDLADGSLRDRVKECHAQGLCGVPAPELLQYFREASEALDYLHRQHVLHRDIKPENILLLQQHAKLADFGLARMQQQSQRLMSATGSGTPLYMAPEIWGGKVSLHSDQYSLAMTYAELRLDRRLYSGKDLMQMMLDHLEGTPDLAPLPEAEQQVILKGLAKEPEQRYPNCLEFARALEQALTPERGRSSGLAPDTRIGGSTAAPSTASSQVSDRDLATATTTHVPTPKPRPGAYATAQAMPTLPPAGRDQPAQPAGSPKSGRGRRVALLGLVLLPVVAALAYAGWLKWQPSPVPDPGTNAAVVSPSTVGPRADDVDWKPAGCEKAEGATIEKDRRGQRYYSHLIKVKDGQRIDFRLIPQRAETEPATFYMMENKVWNDLFQTALKDSMFLGSLRKFEMEGTWKVKREWSRPPSAGEKDD